MHIATLLMITGLETRLLCMGLSMLLPTVLCVQMSLRTASSSNLCTYFYAHLQQASFKCLTRSFCIVELVTLDVAIDGHVYSKSQKWSTYNYAVLFFWAKHTLEGIVMKNC